MSEDANFYNSGSRVSEIRDPRPDLVGDSHYWIQVLRRAFDVSAELGWILNGFRGQGCTLVINPVIGRGKITPILDGSSGWKDVDHYKEYANKYLGPFTDSLKLILMMDQLPGRVKRIPSPWPDITGEFVYVVHSEAERAEFYQDGRQDWTFAPKELAGLQREHDATDLLKWRGKGGRYLGPGRTKETEYFAGF